MRVLLIGGGGREHALAWKLRRDRPDVELFLAPGNAGSAPLGTPAAIKADDVDGLLELALAKSIDLTLVGPEIPLAAGIADRFGAAGLVVFGPSKAAAQIEASKAWAKAFMRRHGIPTAQSASFDSPDEAVRYIRQLSGPPVVKDDALAGGKGVTVAASTEEAVQAAKAILEKRPGAQVVVEERLEGVEVSAQLFSDGRTVRLMPFACDYKRVGDGDSGPNTGGMGAYAPAGLTEATKERILREIVQPAIDGLAAEGRPYVGVLYPGLMITADGPKVLEFNCRFGDPETQALMPLLQSDLLAILLACVQGRLDQLEPRWASANCCTVVLASAGYPDNPQVAEEPRGLDDVTDAVVFRAGTSGRLLSVSGMGASLAEARQRAYAGIRQIEVSGSRYRTDVGAFDRAAGV